MESVLPGGLGTGSLGGLDMPSLGAPAPSEAKPTAPQLPLGF